MLLKNVVNQRTIQKNDAILELFNIIKLKNHPNSAQELATLIGLISIKELNENQVSQLKELRYQIFNC